MVMFETIPESSAEVALPNSSPKLPRSPSFRSSAARNANMGNTLVMSLATTVTQDQRKNHGYIRRKPVGSIDLGRLAAANLPSLLPTPVSSPSNNSGSGFGSYNSRNNFTNGSSNSNNNNTNEGAGSALGNGGGASTSSTVNGLRRSNSAIIHRTKVSNSPPTSSTTPTSKASFQFPASMGGFYETTNYRHINPNTSAKSFSTRRPLSYVTNNNNNNKTYDNTDNNGDKSQLQPSRRQIKGHSPSYSMTNSIAIGVPSFEHSSTDSMGSGNSDGPATCSNSNNSSDAGWRWKYHIKPHRGSDLFMTTNPDVEHMEQPVASSYFVSVSRTALEGGRGFSLSFIDPVKRFCEIVVTRQFRGDNDFFEVLLYKKMENFDFGFGEISGIGSTSSLVSGGRGLTGEENVRLARQVAALADGALLVSSERTVLAWKGCAFLRDNGHQQQKRSSSSLSAGSGGVVREYVLQDDWRRTWVIGTKKPRQVIDSDDELDESTNFSQFANKLLAPRRSTSDVYFSLQQSSSECGDRLISVLQRRNGGGKKHGRSRSYDDRFRDTGNNSKGDAPDFGTLSVFEKVNQNIWPVSIALSVAVSYALHLDSGYGHHRFSYSHATNSGGRSSNEGSHSVTEKFKRLGRKYKEGRHQVFYGNAL